MLSAPDNVLHHFTGHAAPRTLKSKCLHSFLDLDEIKAVKYRKYLIKGFSGCLYSENNERDSFQDQMRMHFWSHS